MLRTSRACCVALAASAAVALTGVSSTVLAGGLKDEPVAEMAVHDWSGFYVGVGVGIGSFDHDAWAEASRKDKFEKQTCYDDDYYKCGYKTIWSALNGEAHHSDDLWDGFGTIQLGADRQIGRFVIGVFADYDWHFDAVSKFSDAGYVDTYYRDSYKEKWKKETKVSFDGEFEKEGV